MRVWDDRPNTRQGGNARSVGVRSGVERGVGVKQKDDAHTVVRGAETGQPGTLLRDWGGGRGEGGRNGKGY